jgi:protein YIPF5/7
LHDEDIGGPFLICVVLGGILLLGGKLHFGYLFGYSVAGSLLMKMLLSLMAQIPISIYHTMSVLGYCLMPMIVLALSGLFITANTLPRFVIMALCIGWSTHSASSMFVRVLRSTEQMLLFMYPIAMLYTCFALIVMF